MSQAQPCIEYDPSCVECRRDAGKDAAGTTWQCVGHVYLERDRLRAALATAQKERGEADEALAACQSQGYAAVANLYALCRRMVRQKTNLQRDVLMSHATRIASQAGIPTGVMAMLRDATPTDVPALIAERDAALAERDELRDAICPNWQEKGLADKLAALAGAFRSDSETMDEIGEGFDVSYRQTAAALTEARRVLRWRDAFVAHVDDENVTEWNAMQSALAAVLAQEEK